MRKILAMAAAVMALAACAREPKLVIVHVNDTHSHVEPVRSGKYEGRGGVIERAAIVDSLLDKYGKDRVLLLHAGDFSQGTSYFPTLEGKLEPKMLNAFGYDCITIGNHEFDNDIEALCDRLAMLDGPVVTCANIDMSQFEISKYIAPYRIVEKAGMKIGIIGVTSNLSSNVSATISSRIPQLDNVEVINKWAEVLENDEKCDMIILLSHLGYKEDQAVIPQVHHIDLVVGGHSHTFVDEFIYVADADGMEVPIIQAGCWGEELGEIKVW